MWENFRPESGPFVFGHRGVPVSQPENTIESYLAARDLGAHGLEIDVRLTKDGVPVIMHDATVDRTTDGTGAVADLEWAEIQRMHARYADGEVSEFLIPRLEDVFDSVPDDVPICCEFKPIAATSMALVDTVNRVVTDREAAGRVGVSGFDQYALARFRELQPEVPTALAALGRLIKPWLDPQVSGSGTILLYALVVPPEDIPAIQENGVQAVMYGLESPEQMREFEAVGVSGVMIDDLSWATNLSPRRVGAGV